MDEVVRTALAALERRDWAGMRQLLHPYVHWAAGGTAVRGRTKVLAHLKTAPVPGAPASYELRDGQIYRWTGS